MIFLEDVVIPSVLDPFYRNEIVIVENKLNKIWNKHNLTEFQYRVRAYINAKAFTIPDINKNIYVSAFYCYSFSEDALTFAVFHEIGHHHVGRGQVQASCWAINELKRRGVKPRDIDRGVMGLQWIEHMGELRKAKCFPTRPN